MLQRCGHLAPALQLRKLRPQIPKPSRRPRIAALDAIGDADHPPPEQRPVDSRPLRWSVTVATTASKITHQVSGWLARTAVGRLAGRSIASLVRVEVFDRAMTLAAQAFTSILPIVVAVAAFNPSNADQLGGTLAEQLGMTADASRVLAGSLPTAQPSSDRWVSWAWCSSC